MVIKLEINYKSYHSGNKEGEGGGVGKATIPES